MIYAWAIQRVEDPEKWAAQLTDPLPGRARRRESARVVQEELDQLKHL